MVQGFIISGLVGLRLIYWPSLIVLLFLYCTKVNGQKVKYRTLHFDNKNGLPQNTITGLAFDKNHFLWVATHAGLVKFDGLHFEKIRPDVFSNRVSTLLKTRSGQIVAFDDKSSFITTNPRNGTDFYSFPEDFYSIDQKNKIKNFLDHFCRKAAFDTNLYAIIKSAKSTIWSLDRSVCLVQSEEKNANWLLGKSIIPLGKIKLNQSGFIGNNLVGINDKGEIFVRDSLGKDVSIKKIKNTGQLIGFADFIRYSFWIPDKGRLYCIYNNGFYSMNILNGELSLSLIWAELPVINNLNHAVYNKECNLLVMGSSLNVSTRRTPLWC